MALGTLVGAVVVWAVVGLGVAYMARHSRKQYRRLEAVALEHGLDLSVKHARTVAEGAVDGFHVRVVGSRRGPCEIIVATGLDARFRVTPMPSITSVLDGLRSGVADFDDDYLIRASGRADVVSCLGSAGRDAMRRMREAGATIEDDWLILETDDVAEGLAALLAVARGLWTGGATTQERLAHHAATDPSASFREHCLALLLTHFPEAPETTQALEATVRDVDARMQLLHLLTSDGADRDERLITYVSCFPEETAAMFVARALPPTRALVAKTLAGTATPDARALLGALREDSDATVVSAAIAALGAHTAEFAGQLSVVQTDEEGSLALAED